MSLAPIIVFAFNRPESLKTAVTALLRNHEAKDSDLFVFVDGPRNDAEKSMTDATANFAHNIQGFKSLTVTNSDNNKGLGDSIISGVSQIINRYGTAIIIEDDLIVQPNFLRFINLGLDKYKDEKEVFSICGYTNKIKLPKDYTHDAYFCTRSSSWGWATWKDRWDSIDWKLEPWDKFAKFKKDFNRWGGSDCFGMLDRWKQGLNGSWAIRFCFNQFLQNKLSLFPIKSLVINDGFDGAGTNCKKWSRFKYELMELGKTDFNIDFPVGLDKYFLRETKKYHSIPIRIISKIMYMIYR